MHLNDTHCLQTRASLVQVDDNQLTRTPDHRSQIKAAQAYNH